MSFFGWTGKVLEIDLERRKYELITPDRDLYLKFIGGKGLAGHYLYPHTQCDFDDPQMPFLLFTGPLVGTLAPTSGRMTIMSRSGLTQTVADSSVGGRLGTELKRAGLDGIIIRGQSDQWLGVEIEDGQVKFCDAKALLGKMIPEAARSLQNKGSYALVGPAAENGVRFSSLVVDRHFVAGRAGLGLSLAAKRLKYLTVRGSGSVVVADVDGLRKARQQIMRQISASPVLMGKYGITHLGTPALFDLMHARRMMPTDNFRKTHFDQAPKVNAHAISERYQPQHIGCQGCHIRCKKQTPKGDALPEFESLSHFTALLKNDDLALAVEANQLCNDLGMDTISAASTLACYQEQSGEKLSGQKLLDLLTDIGQARGTGAELAQGSYRYATKHQRPDCSISVKGLELPAYDPRGAYGMALAYATSTRGACHLRAYPISHEILRKPVATDRFSFEGKARIIKIAEDLNAIVDSLTACKFVFFASSLEEYAKAFQAVTGVEMSANQLSLVGERIYYQERMMNAKNGFDSKDDDLPPRFFKEPGSSGSGFSIPPLDRKQFIEVRKKYYRIRGLDPNGRPLTKKAKELGLEWNSHG
jgi:aldehyde:ferredoxin oxidoreductase